MTNPLLKLTPRELDVAQELIKGHCNKTIAKNLNITAGTVKLHLKHIYEKLNVNSKLKAAIIILKYYDQAIEE